MALGASLRRRTKVVLVVAVFLVGLFAGDMLGDHNILGGIKGRFQDGRRAKFEAAWLQHADQALAEFDATYGERVRALEDEMAPVPDVDPAVVALLVDVEALRKALGFHRRIQWEGFRMEEESARFRPTRPLTLGDLPDEARERIERIAAWDAENPHAHWGAFREDVLSVASPACASFCSDRFQLALAEVIPADHAYWRSIARLTFLSSYWGPPIDMGWSCGNQAVLRWLMESGAEGRALVKEQLNPPSRVREQMIANGLGALRSMVSGFASIGSDPDALVEGRFVAPPPVAAEDIETFLRALEVVGRGRQQGESWRPQAVGALADLRDRMEWLRPGYGIASAVAAAEEHAILWRWANGEVESPFLNPGCCDNPLFVEAWDLLMPPVEAQ